MAVSSCIAQQTGKEDYVAEFIKVTPSPLPQSPVAPRVSSDRRDESLRGRIKILLEEKEYLDNTAYPPGRHKTGEREFGPDGNLVTQRFYDYRGNPKFVVAYGYLNGKRVSKTGAFIQHSYDPPPMMALPGTYTPQPKGDERYTSAWEFKYDKKGRIIEELRSNNRGIADFRSAYEYDKNVRKESFCNVPCNYTPHLNIYTFNEKGMETRLETKDSIGGSESVTDFKYLLFDSQGNWTKREATGKLISSRGDTKPIHYIEYRTFTYFEIRESLSES